MWLSPEKQKTLNKDILAGQCWGIFNPNTQEAQDLCELEAMLVYRASSRTTRVTERNPVWKNQNQTKPKRTFLQT